MLESAPHSDTPPRAGRELLGSKSTAQRLFRIAVVLWAIGVLVISVRVFLQPTKHSVYPTFAQAGRDWLARAELYGKSTVAVDQFRYSPLVAASFVPFAVLSERAGNLLWHWVNVGVLLGALVWWVRVALGVHDSGRLRSANSGRLRSADSGRLRSRLAWILILVLPLALGTMNNGQSNALVLGLMLAAVAASMERRWGLAALTLSLACLFKVYPIALALLLVVAYPRPLTWRLVVALAAGIALPFVLQNPAYVTEEYLAWLRHLGGDDRQTWPVELTYRDLRLLCRVWWSPIEARTYQIIQGLTAIGIAGICFVLRHLLPSRGKTLDQQLSEQRLLLSLFALASCWMTVFGAATESSTYVILAPALAAVLVTAWQEDRPHWERLLLASCYGLLLAAQIANWFPFGRWFHTLGPQPAAGLVFFVYLLLRAFLVGADLDRRARRDLSPVITFPRAA